MKILFVNAMGYGNIGDDTYPIIFKRYFEFNHDLYFMNSDVKPIPKNLDLIVFGGGGLIFDKPGEAHLSYMERYMKYAVRNNIPYGFISVGIQCRKYKESNNWNYESYAKNWVKWFKKCNFASFRDVGSLSYFIKTTGRKDFIQAPDLCYLFKKQEDRVPEDYCLVIPGAKIKTSNKEVLKILQEYKDIKIMNMGGAGTDASSIEFKKMFPNSQLFLSKDLFPSLAFKLISESAKVITGRYHGLIFSRIANKEFWVNNPSQYKIQVEDLNSEISLSIKHIKLLKYEMRRIRCQ